MRAGEVWLSTCVICGTSIENRGSGRARNACSPAHRAERRRRAASAHYRRRKPTAKKRIKLMGPKAYERYRFRDEVIIRDEKLRRGSCSSCGLFVTQENAALFDFDHTDRNSKGDTISNMKGRRSSPDDLIAEMSKCLLLCCLCHRKKTLNEKDFVPLVSTSLSHPTLFDN